MKNHYGPINYIPGESKIKRTLQGRVSIDKVFDKLLFITNRGKGKGGESDHFQFSIISIRDKDFTLIYNSIKDITRFHIL